MPDFEKFYNPGEGDKLPERAKKVVEEIGKQTDSINDYGKVTMMVERLREVPNVTIWRKEIVEALNNNMVTLNQELQELIEDTDNDFNRLPLHRRKSFIASLMASVARAELSFMEVTEFERSILISEHELDIKNELIPKFREIIISLQSLLAEEEFYLPEEYIVPTEISFSRNGKMITLEFEVFDDSLISDTRNWRMKEELDAVEAINEPGMQIGYTSRFPIRHCSVNIEEGTYFMYLEGELLGIYDEFEKRFIADKSNDEDDDLLDNEDD